MTRSDGTVILLWYLCYGATDAVSRSQQCQV